MPESWMPVAEGRPLSLEELPRAARELLENAGSRKVWIFYGEMGAGKTTLIKSICSMLGVLNGTSSPTFSIVNEYTTSHEKIFHFDFYRIKNEMEALDIGVEEYFDSGSYCFVEWPEKIVNLLPDNIFQIRVVHQGADARKIEFAR